jgi:hypothetical protein
MARYTHKVSGARVEVRDNKVMDSSWEAEAKAPAKKAAAKAPAKSDDES